MKTILKSIISIMLLSILSSTYLFPSQVATKDDIKMLITYMDKRFDDVNKRFDDSNKRFESIQHNMDKRFESIQHNMDKRFDDVNKRFESTNNLIYALMSLVSVIFTVIIWDRRSMMESTVKQASENAKKMIEEQEKQRDEILLKHLLKKADKDILNKIILSLKEIYKDNKESREIFAKHHIEFS